jgi:hypothetical protein
MSTTISGKSEVVLALTGVNTSTVRRSRDEFLQDLLHTWISGATGDYALNAQYAGQLTITQAAANATIDLQTVLDAFGDAMALTELRLMVVQVVKNDQNDSLEISGGASNALTSLFAAVSGGKLPAQAGEVLCKSSPIVGYAVDGTHKTVKFTRVSGGAPDTDDLVVNVWLAGLRPA